jgi:hypothetical protein
MSQSAAFAVLGYDCGGIKETVYATGFDTTNGYPNGEVYLLTTCSCGKDCSTRHTAWATVTWDFAGNTIAYAPLTNATVDPNFMATDAYDDILFNTNGAAYLAVPTPAMSTGVTAVQTNDQFDISWTPIGVDPDAVISSVLTATPVNSTNSVLTTNVAGSARTGIIPFLQPGTTYHVTVVNATIGGAGPASSPFSVTTSSTPIPPAAPTNVTAHWLNPDPSGSTDTLVALWQAPNPGDSPIDAYLIMIVASEGGSTFTQTVSGTTLTAYFTVDYIPNWSVTVQAHNSFGWSPTSAVYRLGGL